MNNETKLTDKELYHIMSWVFVMSLLGLMLVAITASIAKQYTIFILEFVFLLAGIYAFFKSAKYYALMHTN